MALDLKSNNRCNTLKVNGLLSRRQTVVPKRVANTYKLCLASRGMASCEMPIVALGFLA
jgi:hypothetical protein